ncbi:MAG: single-stranded DNA-binding protein [Anaerolineae bacterium]|nr:single-stranded DNA-binding protein [Anaerolineae bacterium]
MFSYMSTTLVGHVGNNPDLRYTQAGKAVCNFSLAVNLRRGEGKEIVRWFRVACWEQLAETANQYIKKGDPVMVVAGDISASAYAGSDGKPAAGLEVTARQLVFLRSKGETETESEGWSDDGNQGDIPF